VGSVIGIGLYKGARNINFRVLGEIGIGWIATPVFSGLLAFFSLFFVKNIFSIDVGRKTVPGMAPGFQNGGAVAVDPGISGIMLYLLPGLLIAGSFGVLLYYFLKEKGEMRLKIGRKVLNI
jgi:hypothetical protein